MKYYFDKKLAPLTSDEVDIRIEETLKFLNMAVHCGGQIPVSREIDEVWHYWILETAEYQKLCAKLDGGLFVNHSSNDYAEYHDSNAKNLKIDLEHGISFLSSYVRNYGAFEQNRLKYWPVATYLLDIPGWNLDKLNEWLASAFQSGKYEAAE